MLRLREIEEKDLQKINIWRNDYTLVRCLGTPYRYISYEVDKEWFNNYEGNRNNQVRCAIIEEEDEILGLVSLTDINQINQSAQFHIMIGDFQNHNKGIGTFAIKEMLKHAFNNLNLNRVELTVLDSNARARHLYEKCGFMKEGIKRQAVYKNGKFEDLYMYSILKSEFIEDNIDK